MLRLTPRRRAVLADKVPDVTNIIAGALVIGFLVGEPRAPGTLLLAVLALWGAVLVFALMIAEDRT
ncbi:MAG: hypothetical protein HY824_12960 [Acidobacteria bacterium]|nr:hypothetical protein [Acidobacteriota bacterium]